MLVGQHGLTARQALVLGHVLDHGRITIGELEELCPGTPRRTLQRDLKALVDKGLLVRSGSTNRHEYRPRVPSDLAPFLRHILRHSCAGP